MRGLIVIWVITAITVFLNLPRETPAHVLRRAASDAGEVECIELGSMVAGLYARGVSELAPEQRAPRGTDLRRARRRSLESPDSRLVFSGRPVRATDFAGLARSDVRPNGAVSAREGQANPASVIEQPPRPPPAGVRRWNVVTFPRLHST